MWHTLYEISRSKTQQYSSEAWTLGGSQNTAVPPVKTLEGTVPPCPSMIYATDPSIHYSMGSAPVSVQCPFTSSLGEFPGYWNWLWYPWISPVLVSIAVLPYLGVFPFTLLHLPLNFIRVSYLRLMFLHPSVDLPLTHFVKWVSRLGTGSGIWCCGPRGGIKTIKFLF